MNLPNVPLGDQYFFELMKYIDTVIDQNKYVLGVLTSVLFWIAPKTKNKWDDWIAARLRKRLSVSESTITPLSETPTGQGSDIVPNKNP